MMALKIGSALALSFGVAFGGMSAAASDGPVIEPVQYRSFEQKYDDGACRVERRLERNGTFREERRCRGLPSSFPGGRAFKEEFDDGRCEVERELERDGDYREERVCRPRRDGRPTFGIDVRVGPLF